MTTPTTTSPDYYHNQAAEPIPFRVHENPIPFHFGEAVSPPAINRLKDTVGVGLYFEYGLAQADMAYHKSTGGSCAPGHSFTRYSLQAVRAFAAGNYHFVKTVHLSVDTQRVKDVNGKYVYKLVGSSATLLDNDRAKWAVMKTGHPSLAFERVIHLWETFSQGAPIVRYVRNPPSKQAFHVQFAVADSPFFMPLNSTDARRMLEGQAPLAIANHTSALWRQTAIELDRKIMGTDAARDPFITLSLDYSDSYSELKTKHQSDGRTAGVPVAAGSMLDKFLLWLSTVDDAETPATQRTRRPVPYVSTDRNYTIQPGRKATE